MPDMVSGASGSDYNFVDALAQSVNDAVLYLEHGEHSNNQVANGKTYKQLRKLVDRLADALCQPPTPTKANPPQSPQIKINFFAEDPAGAPPDNAALPLPLLGDSNLTDMLQSDVSAPVNPMSGRCPAEQGAVAITVETTPAEITPTSEKERANPCPLHCTRAS